MSIFKKAERKQVHLKLAITGPSGGGKTYSALKIAKGLASNEPIAFIDTESGSGSLYADLPGMPTYQIIELTPPFTSERYMQLIKEAVKENFKVLIIDSISHQWSGEGGIMDRLDREKIAKPGANSFTLWAKFTPEHERFKQAILQAPIHIIATMRSKQDYIMEQNEKGKSTPRKVGLAPVQREGAEYEFTTVFDMNQEHYATVSKDRTALFDGEVFRPSEETGQKILHWIQSGASSKSLKQEIAEKLLPLGYLKDQIKSHLKQTYQVENPNDLSTAQMQSFLEWLSSLTIQKQHFASPEFEEALKQIDDPRSF